MTFYRIFAVALVALPTASTAQEAALWLRGAQVVDPATRSVIARDILIVDGRVAAPDTTVPTGTREIDVRGKWILPGLVDLHVHFPANALPDGKYEDLTLHETARRMLYCGVVAFLDLGTSTPAEFFAARDRQRAQPLAATDEADLYGAGTPFGFWVMRDPAAAHERLDSYLKQYRPDVIKIILQHRQGRTASAGEQAALAAVFAGAKTAGLKTVVHVGSWEDARAAVAGGATAITHFDDGAVIPDELADEWARRGILSVPTMAVQCDMAAIVQHHEMLNDLLLCAVTPSATRARYRENQNFSNRAVRTIGWQIAGRDHDFATLVRLRQRGVVFLTGSDTNNLGTFQGYSLHREIQLLAEAGLSNWDALAAATTRAAEFLGRGSGIQNGDIAELVVLDADPTTDVANTKKIFAVVHHGQVIDRRALKE
ncbi:MAG TPA: amidohydrolase family protein [Candidatus Didemnitutus sp.]|nr:amidohydrolase family protein [Candidatus Didemnitutus sp.]